jgi:anti-sigma factor RsiW
MTCDEREPTIGAYVDGELDLSTSLELEEHSAGCERCTNYLTGLRAIKSSLATDELRHAVPHQLRTTIETKIAQAAAQDRMNNPGAVILHRNYALLFATSALVCLLISLELFSRAPTSSHVSLLANQVVDCHLRSQMAGHLTDIASSDPTEVQAWLTRRLSFQPAIVDASNQGAALIGGRLDYMDNKPVAAIVYRENKKVINVFEWKSGFAEPANEPPKSLALRGFAIEYWRKNGMAYWIISDSGQMHLDEFSSVIEKS